VPALQNDVVSLGAERGGAQEENANSIAHTWKGQYTFSAAPRA